MENKNAIRQLRKAAGMTQEELALKIGVTNSAIGHYERGIRKLEPTKLEAMANIFNVSIDEILGVQKVEIKETKKAVHGNSRKAKMDQYFDELTPIQQRVILQQTQALVKQQKVFS